MLISEASAITGIPARTIKRWCLVGKIGKARRAGNRRIYTLSDADLVTLRTLAEERQQKRDRSGRFKRSNAHG